MRLTQKTGREQLIPISTNVPPLYPSKHGHHGSTHSSQEKNSAERSMSKNEHGVKINSLQSVLQGLKHENDGTRSISRNQSQDSLNLKGSFQDQMRSINNPQTPRDHPRTPREHPQISSIRYHNGDQMNKLTFELDKAIYQNNALIKENEELKKYIQELERSKGGFQQPFTPRSGHINQMADSVPSIHVSKMVEQYEDHIAAMAGKISTVHKLEFDVSNLNKEKALILKDFEGMRQELANRIAYCEHLEKELKNLELGTNFKINSLQPNSLQTNNQQVHIQQPNNQPNHFQPNMLSQKTQNNQIIPVVDPEMLVKYRALEVEVVKLTKEIEEKDMKINNFEQKSEGFIQVLRDEYEDLQANVFSLTERLNTSTMNYQKETEKSAKLQIEINRLNVEIGEKIRNLECSEETIKKLETEKAEMITSLTKTKAELKQLEKKYEDRTIKLDKVTEDLEKTNQLSALTQEYLTELESLKKKAKESDELAKKQQTKIENLELKYNDTEIQNQRAFSQIEESKERYEVYERTIKDQNLSIRRLNERNALRLEELDTNIRNNISLQDKLRELHRRNESLTDEIEQCIIENYYVKATDEGKDTL